MLRTSTNFFLFFFPSFLQGAVERGRVSPHEYEWTVQWLQSHAPVRSGTENEKRLQWGTWKDTHAAYVKDVTEQTHWKPRSKPFLTNIAKSLGIKKAKFDKYLCLTCWQGTYCP